MTVFRVAWREGHEPRSTDHDTAEAAENQRRILRMWGKADVMVYAICNVEPEEVA